MVYRKGNRVLAVATIGRDRVCLQAEAAFERNDLKALEFILNGQQ